MTLRECLNKFKRAFNNLPNLNYYIDNAVIPYAESGNNEYYQEYTKILDEEVFTLRCQVGYVYCLIEYSYDDETDKTYYGATFENTLNGEKVFIQDDMDYNAEQVNKKLFDIFD